MAPRFRGNVSGNAAGKQIGAFDLSVTEMVDGMRSGNKDGKGSLVKTEGTPPTTVVLVPGETLLHFLNLFKNAFHFRVGFAASKF